MKEKFTNMTNQEVKAQVDQVFAMIGNAISLEELVEIEEGISLPKRSKMSVEAYPPIRFSLSPVDIRYLQEKEILSKSWEISTDLADKLQDPFAKLLYALSWKNGDLRKVKHIVAGIMNKPDAPDSEKTDGLVFYQFGKFLKQEEGEPIIDQHVLRAFGVYKADNSDEAGIARLRNLTAVTKKEQGLIDAYKKWLREGPGLQDAFRETVGYTYHLDKLLFAIGKTIKITKRKGHIWRLDPKN